MATWFDNQLSNRNFLSPIGFLFVLDKARKTSFLCQKVNVPTLSLGEYNVQTGLVPIPVEGNLSFGNLTIDFLVDEDLKNYMEIHNWMRALGAPDDIEKNRLVLYIFIQCNPLYNFSSFFGAYPATVCDTLLIYFLIHIHRSIYIIYTHHYIWPSELFTFFQ